VTAKFNGLFAYSIGSNGSLTLITGSPFKTGREPFNITVDPSGKFVYVCNEKSIRGYRISSTGSLKNLPWSPLYIRLPSCVAVDPTASFAFVARGDHSYLTVESIGAKGALTEVDQIREDRPYNVAVDPTGTFAYVVNGGTNAVSAYRIESTGKLKRLADSPFATGSFPFDVVVDQTGKFLYVTNTGANSISGYRIRSSGALSPLPDSPFRAEKTPYRLAVAP
jgi:DNA-binding beta-propeller fold protein YncE